MINKLLAVKPVLFTVSGSAVWPIAKKEFDDDPTNTTAITTAIMIMKG
jgi:hypothetical protein